MRRFEGSLGRLPLPPDDRDLKLGSILEAYSTRKQRFWWEGAVWLDQGPTGTCVGNAWTHWLADGPTLHNQVFDEAWARHLYVEATGDTTLQQGAYTRQALDVLVRWGLVGAYYRAQSFDEIRTYLLDEGPMEFACSWRTGMDNYYVDEHGWPWLQNTGSVRGGHEFILNGINIAPQDGSPPFVRMKNSWGRGWARGGNAKISLETLQELFNEDPDCFVATELSPNGGSGS